MARKFELLILQSYESFLSSGIFWFSAMVIVVLILGTLSAVYVYFFNRNLGGRYFTPHKAAHSLVGVWFFNAIGYWFIVDFPIGAFLYKISPTLHLIFEKGFYYLSVVPVIKLLS